ncbi:MAG: grasp-with-spasm system SPASM domain peptide maturase [Bacteroidales bacterium]|nr:grasp-with-spasm system SPASM domain peptide maturase [Bacteroidales bacterium]
MVISNDYVFKLFANCKVVQGAARSIICDLNGRVFIIPSKFNSFLDLLKDENGIAYEAISSNDGLKELTEELEQKQMGRFFKTDSVENFPDIRVSWSSPHPITNAIIDVDEKNDTDWEKFILQLDAIGCPFLQIRNFGEISFQKLNSILEIVDQTDVNSVQLIIPFNNQTNFWVELLGLINLFPRVADVIVYNHINKKPQSVEDNRRVRITSEMINNQNSCGNIKPYFFTLKVDFFNEAHLFNTCLNRKVALTPEGFIKNCPSMAINHGNIKDVNLADIIKRDEFKFWWSVKKDDIEVCKDCEFRYICSDCRAFTADINNPYSKPSKCPYDPYTCIGF